MHYLSLTNTEVFQVADNKSNTPFNVNDDEFPHLKRGDMSDWAGAQGTKKPYIGVAYDTNGWAQNSVTGDDPDVTF